MKGVKKKKNLNNLLYQKKKEFFGKEDGEWNGDYTWAAAWLGEIHTLVRLCCVKTARQVVYSSEST